MTKKKKWIIAIPIVSAVLILLICFALFYNDVYYLIMVSKFERSNKSIETGQVVFVGDSITDWYDLDKYYPEIKIYNRGIAGDTTSGLIKRINSSAVDLEPKVLVLLIGINDMLEGDSNEEILRNYEKILDVFKEKLPQTEVLIQSVYPTHSGFLKMIGNKKQQIIEMNRRLQEYAGEYGYRYVDVYTSLIDENNNFKKEYSKDGLHPNKKAYEVITSIIKPILEELI